MNQWTYVHGEGDDPLGAPTYVETAYGVSLTRLYHRLKW